MEDNMLKINDQIKEQYADYNDLSDLFAVIKRRNSIMPDLFRPLFDWLLILINRQSNTLLRRRNYCLYPLCTLS